jgi:hypothetical protein
MHRKISSIGRGLAFGAGLVVVLAGASAAARPAFASTDAPHIAAAFYNFTSGSAALSGGGHTWKVATDVQSAGGTNVVGVTIETPHLGGLEQHSWTGLVSASAVTIGSSGAMTVSSGAGLAPYATVTLTFKPTGHKTSTANCLTGSEINYTGTYSGSVTINTGLKGLKLSGAHLTFKGTNQLTNLDTCKLAPCIWSSWTTPSNSDGAFAGGMTFAYPGRPVVSNVDIVSVKTLSTKRTLFRSDSFVVTKTPQPKFSKSTKSLSFTAGSAGLITGAGTLSHGKPGSFLNPDEKTCKFNGQLYSVSGTQYSKAAFKSARQFEAHSILNGLIKIRTTGSDSFTITTLKKK